MTHSSSCSPHSRASGALQPYVLEAATLLAGGCNPSPARPGYSRASLRACSAHAVCKQCACSARAAHTQCTRDCACAHAACMRYAHGWRRGMQPRLSRPYVQAEYRVNARYMQCVCSWLCTIGHYARYICMQVLATSARHAFAATAINQHWLTPYVHVLAARSTRPCSQRPRPPTTSEAQPLAQGRPLAREERPRISDARAETAAAGRHLPNAVDVTASAVPPRCPCAAATRGRAALPWRTVVKGRARCL